VSDIKLFRMGDVVPEELQGTSVALEKNLQATFEKHLDVLLGVRFLASEYATGKTHSGRIDTLGIDENNSPVIIEYKRSLNQNVINQGLFYLDWLLDHRAEFTLLAMEKLGSEIQDKIEWTSPRLLCIAGNYTRYDEHAVQQINRNIELLRYRWYEKGFLLVELVNAVATVSTTDLSETEPNQVGKLGKTTTQYKSVSEFLAQASPDLSNLYQSLHDFVMAFGDDVQMKVLKLYFAYRRIKNFACVEVHPQAGKLLVFAKVDPDSIDLVEGFTRDVRNIGHFGTGDLEITLRTSADLEKAQPLIVASYEMS
jgi:predicted transport protein